MKFVRVEYDNNRVAGAELTSHREVIEEYALKGYKYLGFVPVKLGPSGKMLALDLVFDNKYQRVQQCCDINEKRSARP